MDAMLAEMSAKQLREWMEFYRIDPWSEERADIRAAIVAHTVAVSSGASRKDKRPMKIEDFMPEFGAREKAKAKPVQSAKAIKAMFNAVFGHVMSRAPKPEGESNG